MMCLFIQICKIPPYFRDLPIVARRFELSKRLRKPINRKIIEMEFNYIPIYGFSWTRSLGIVTRRAFLYIYLYVLYILLQRHRTKQISEIFPMFPFPYTAMSLYCGIVYCIILNVCYKT